MAHVLMPRLGVSVTEGTVSAWLKQVGDPVEVGEPICEVATDKVDTEIESTVAGVLTEQLYAVDEVVEVGAPLATVAAADEATAAPAPAAPEPTAPEPTPSIVPDPAGFGDSPDTGPYPEPPAPELGPRPEGADDQYAVVMPRLGVSVTEGTVSAWLKQVGDPVELGEPICEVATDKVDTEIESTVAGVLAEQRHAEGEVVLVGEPLALVTPDGALPSAAPAAPAPPASEPTAAPAAGAAPTAQPAPQRAAQPSATAGPTVPGRPAELRPAPFDHTAAVDRLLATVARAGRPVAAPSARRLAAELGVDLALVPGTGGGGHVTRADVQRAAEQPAAAPVVAATPSAAPAPAAPAAPVPETTGHPVGPDGLPIGYEDVPYDAVPTSRIRRVTAEHMTRSRRTAAHMTTEVDVDLGLLTDVRARLNAHRATQGRGKLSFLPFVARATCAALLEHPDLNATFETERLLRWGEINLGIAVDTPRGLMVPVLRGAERMTVETLGEGITDLAARLRDGKPGPDDFRAGTFTISNPGSVGAVSAPAIINQPQVAILGMPTIQRRPWVVRLADGQETIAIRPILRLALTFDHRALDGADATRCLVDIGRRLETWDVDDYR
ncbi:2-oxoglutarate dehydrogenase, E2 component, dihydrolipoamide succinyltransferase [Nocardioides deserti]|uniref:Dihydrolipoamide acetyltransferase component of pyruvate dehydrogenase complex n=1 Tax=Nocardioides deserti TaxID=1588644 RepID=A0ABR6U7K8_9ACTN|nr:2-oxoglutarate dehydrogenase, E2 component, dihydrolipoamide succinyltransferase [Nocardioides deserti]MBC2960406.1 2-oxoglutarate dehydrogenase, E2 component, dihydrolipoamide succinyltransferase [Nocardioides deserti]GGO71487.1 dihydrolipoamide acetyltransferase component of pyruvate dehydrogenase complex [Nocardioides deserti]